jgi:hypothetical protein
MVYTNLEGVEAKIQSHSTKTSASWSILAILALKTTNNKKEL